MNVKTQTVMGSLNQTARRRLNYLRVQSKTMFIHQRMKQKRVNIYAIIDSWII